MRLNAAILREVRSTGLNFSLLSSPSAKYHVREEPLGCCTLSSKPGGVLLLTFNSDFNGEQGFAGLSWVGTPSRGSGWGM